MQHCLVHNHYYSSQPTQGAEPLPPVRQGKPVGPLRQPAKTAFGTWAVARENREGKLSVRQRRTHETWVVESSNLEGFLGGEGPFTGSVNIQQYKLNHKLKPLRSHLVSSKRGNRTF